MKALYSFLKALCLFFADLFRNRRNRACTACVVVFGSWTVFWFVWGVVSLVHLRVAPVPYSVLSALTIISGLKGWKDHTDARYPGQAPATPPSAL